MMKTLKRQFLKYKELYKHKNFSRQNGFCQRIVEFVKELNLSNVSVQYAVDFTHQFIRDDKTFVSTIDHLFCNRDVEKSIIDAGVYHSIENTSDRHPIYCKMKYSYPELDNKRTTIYHPNHHVSMIQEHNFRGDLQTELNIDVQMYIVCVMIIKQAANILQ